MAAHDLEIEVRERVLRDDDDRNDLILVRRERELVDVLAGKVRRRAVEVPTGLRGVVALTVVATVALLALTAVAPWLPGSEIVDALRTETS